MGMWSKAHHKIVFDVEAQGSGTSRRLQDRPEGELYLI